MKIKYTQDKSNITYGNKHFIDLMTKDAVKKCDSKKKWESAILFLVGVVGGALFIDGINYDNNNTIYGAILFILPFMLYFFIEYICIRKNQCKVGSDENFRVNKHIEIQLTEDNLITIVPGLRSIYEWSHLNHYKLDKDYLTIGMTKYQGECIPLNIFESENERRKFIDKIASKIKRLGDHEKIDL